MNWRFYPLQGFTHQGVLVPSNGHPVIAEFLTPQQAKSLQERKERAA